MNLAQILEKSMQDHDHLYPRQISRRKDWHGGNEGAWLFYLVFGRHERSGSLRMESALEARGSVGR